LFWSYHFFLRSSRKVSGIPVIFVPGSSGSVEQIRSIGSILHNKTENRNSPFSFDVFGIDFNQELSGISGMYLERQIRFLRLAVDKIWNMYSPQPVGLIFVGHSMGGIIIRSLFYSHDFDLSRISLAITLATPHSAPPFVFDYYMERFYEKMRLEWKERAEQIKNITVISISGGLKDILVPEHLTQDSGIHHFSTTSIDTVEVEVDHLCIVWCNQLQRYFFILLNSILNLFIYLFILMNNNVNK
uniref:GPI inositol-deacylase n=1 Tax=Dracunculus medinensis TaxID=318479 RepID=A0A0N4U531_DRAME